MAQRETPVSLFLQGLFQKVKVGIPKGLCSPKASGATRFWTLQCHTLPSDGSAIVI